MAGFSSVLSAVPQIVSGVSMVADVVGNLSAQNDVRKEQQQALKSLQSRQAAEYDYALREANAKRAEIAQKSASDEQLRQAALKRAMARQQAKFGASGITTGSSGSAQALLLGLFDESEQEKSRRNALDALRYQSINDDLAYKNRVNILALDDLRARQKIGGLTSWANTISRLS